MYTPALVVHSFLRWALLLSAVAAFGRSLLGWKAGRVWDSTDEWLAKVFVVVLHLQLLLGVLLYISLSPITAAAFADMKVAMKDRTVRFFVAEHVAGMMLAFVTVMVARVRSKRKTDPGARHRAWALGIGFFLLVVAAAIPWPGLAYGRPWFRGF